MTFAVGIDARMLQHTGIGTYLRGILSGLQPPASLTIGLFGAAGGNGHDLPFEARPFNSQIYTVREQLEYPVRLSECRLWHSPHYNVPLMKGKCRLVVTIHDIIHWIYRRQFLNPLQAAYAGRMMRAAVRTADRIIAVSQSTKLDLIQHFNALPEKIEVIYEGVSADFEPVKHPAAIEEVLKKHAINGPYFLYVGMIKPHKNILWLLQHFRELRRQKKIKTQLVLVGRKDRNYPEGHEALADLGSDADVVYIPKLEWGELRPLYAGATALVHPSLYEGFGLTLLEAMACGTPVIAGRTSSIPEVTGDAARLVDLNDPADLMTALAEMESNSALRHSLIARGLARAAQFRWQDAAAKTLQVYQDVLGPA